jgi:hypothetical protein
MGRKMAGQKNQETRVLSPEPMFLPSNAPDKMDSSQSRPVKLGRNSGDIQIQMSCAIRRRMSI